MSIVRLLIRATSGGATAKVFGFVLLWAACLGYHYYLFGHAKEPRFLAEVLYGIVTFCFLVTTSRQQFDPGLLQHLEEHINQIPRHLSVLGLTVGGWMAFLALLSIGMIATHLCLWAPSNLVLLYRMPALDLLHYFVYLGLSVACFSLFSSMLISLFTHCVVLSFRVDCLKHRYISNGLLRTSSTTDLDGMSKSLEEANLSLLDLHPPLNRLRSTWYYTLRIACIVNLLFSCRLFLLSSMDNDDSSTSPGLQDTYPLILFLLWVIPPIVLNSRLSQFQRDLEATLLDIEEGVRKVARQCPQPQLIETANTVIGSINELDFSANRVIRNAKIHVFGTEVTLLHLFGCAFWLALTTQ